MSFLMSEKPLLKETHRGQIYGVMDGVGGAPMGMKAAQYVADQLVNFYTKLDIPATVAGIENILCQSNDDIFSWGLIEETNRPCGASTATLAWFAPDRQLHIFHVGNSAGFLLTTSGLLKVTTEHEDRGGGIYRYIGQGEGFCPEIRGYPLIEGDTLCLVTDGITKGLRMHEIQAIMEDYAGEPDLTAKTLVHFAKRKRVQDDITALVIELIQW